MFCGTPAMAPTAFAGTPLTMKAMPGPLPMPMSMRVRGQPLLHPGVAVEGRRFDLEPVLGEDAGLHADVERA